MTKNEHFSYNIRFHEIMLRVKVIFYYQSDRSQNSEPYELSGN